MAISEDLNLSALQADADPEYRFYTLRCLKNDLIGSDQKKVQYIPAIPQLLSVLRYTEDKPECYVQAITALGSFAYGNETTRDALVDVCRDVVNVLMFMLKHDDYRVVEAAARTLKILYWSGIPRQSSEQSYTGVISGKLTNTGTDPQYKSNHSSLGPNKKRSDNSPSAADSNDTLMDSDTLELLIRLTSHPYGSIAESAAVILSKCCNTMKEQEAVAAAGGLDGLVCLLDSKSPKTVDAALEALAAITHNRFLLCQRLLRASKGIDKKLMRLLREDRNSLRLLSATCLVNLDRMNTVPQLQNAVAMTLLPTLVKLCGDPDTNIRIRAPHVLAYLVEDSEALEKAACEADVISKLMKSFTAANDDTLSESHKTDLREAVLSALASVCAKRESSRKQIIEAKLLPDIVKQLDSPYVQVRSAACRCTRSLSRSVKTLRTALVDAGAAKPLFKLLSDSNAEVQAAACAALCNMVLDFSPMKQSMLDQGVVERLVALTHSSDPELRLNCMWAIKNLLYQASILVRKKVVALLGWQRIYELLNDESLEIQRQTLTCLRNLASGGDECGENAIDLVVKAPGDNPGDNMIAVLVEKMQNNAHPSLVQEAGYVLVNIATGSRKHKNLIMENPECLKCIKACLESREDALKVVAAWCIINLSWPEDEGVEERVRVIRGLGMDRTLRNLKNDPNFDVKGRAEAALEQLEKMPRMLEL